MNPETTTSRIRMKTLLTLIAAALCFAYARSGAAHDEDATSHFVLRQASVPEQRADTPVDASHAESATEAPWQVGHRLALAVERRESRRPAFDASAAVVFLDNAY